MDIEAAARCGADRVHLSFPLSAIHLRALGRSQAWVLQRLDDMSALARRDFDYVSVGVQDAWRCDSTELEPFTQAAADARVDRVRLADSVGIARPVQVAQTFRALGEIRKLRASDPRSSSLELGFHAHDDLGLATANSLAAAEAGADCLDVTVNGLGERAGNAALEQVLVLLFGGQTAHCPYRLHELRAISHEVAQHSGRTLSPSQPIVGELVFAHESGIHVAAQLTDEQSYEPFRPELVGQTRKNVFGRHSGRRGVLAALAEAGQHADHQQVSELLQRIQASARGLSARDVQRMFLELHAEEHPSREEAS